MSPTSRTLGKRGQVSPALGQQVPTLSPASWPAQGSSAEREQGEIGGGRPSVPTAANTPLRDTSHGPGHTCGRLGLGEPGAGPARFPGLMVLALDHLSHLRWLQGMGPTSTQSWQHLECQGAGAFPAARRGQAQCPPRTRASEPWAPQPSAAAPPLLALGWLWVQGTRREAPEAGRGQQTQGCSSLCPCPQAPGRD